MITIREELATKELLRVLAYHGSTFTCCEDEHDVADNLITQDVSHYDIASMVYIKIQCPICKKIYHAILRVRTRPVTVQSMFFESDEAFTQLLDAIKNCISVKQINAGNVYTTMRNMCSNYSTLCLLRRLSPDTIKYTRPCINKGMSHYTDKTEEHIAWRLNTLALSPANRCLPYIIDKVNSCNIKCSLDMLYL